MDKQADRQIGTQINIRLDADHAQLLDVLSLMHDQTKTSYIKSLLRRAARAEGLPVSLDELGRDFCAMFMNMLVSGDPNFPGIIPNGHTVQYIDGKVAFVKREEHTPEPVAIIASPAEAPAPTPIENLQELFGE